MTLHRTSCPRIARIAVAASLALGGTPWSAPEPAAAAPAGVDLYLGDTTVLGGRSPRKLNLVLSAPTPNQLDAATVVFDTTGLTAVATISGGRGQISRCRWTTATRLSCSLTKSIGFGPNTLRGVLEVGVAAAAGAKKGDTGTLRATLTANGLAPITRQATVRVAEGVELTAEPAAPVSAEPDAVFDVPMAVHNAGGATVHGVTLIFGNDRALQPRTGFSNCTYADDQLRTCDFDQELAPGETYRTMLPYRLRADTHAPAGYSSWAQWMTRAEAADLSAYLRRIGEPPGTPGTGAMLTLTEAPQARALPQAEVDPTDNGFNVTVTATGRRGLDLAAVGATVTGAVGDYVTATLGVHNNGPATLDTIRDGENSSHTDLAVPPGVTVTSVPKGCRRLIDGEPDWDHVIRPGGRAYQCVSDYLLRAATSQTFTFGLRIDRVVPDPDGTVTVYDHCGCPQQGVNPDRRNDTAPLVVHATAAVPGATDDGHGGGLPVTGPGGTALGLLLLTAGAVGVALTRRRRTRFVA